MKYTTILLEYSRSKTIERYGEAIGTRFMTEMSTDDGSGNVGDFLILHLAQFAPGFKLVKGWRMSDVVIDFFERIDPTPKNAYVPAMARWYAMGSMKRLEDAVKIKAAIPIIAKFKNKLTGFNIMSVSFDEFLDKADELNGRKSRAEVAKEEEETLYKSGQAEVYYNGPDMKIVIPKTEKAATFFGRGTRWCTSAENDNMFDYYNRQGPLYCILFKGENRRWQFHFESGQFMDERDDYLDENSALFKKTIAHFKQHIDGIIEKSLNEHDESGLSLVRFLPKDRFNEEFILKLISVKSMNVEYIPKDAIPNEIDFWKKAIDIDPYVINYMSTSLKYNEELLLHAVKRDVNAISWMGNWTNHIPENVQIAAVQEDPTIIWAIRNKTPAGGLSMKAALIAVSQGGKLIINVDDPTPEVQMAAVKENDRALQYIDDPAPAVVDYCIRKNPGNVVLIKKLTNNRDKLTPELQLLVVKHNHSLIRFIPNPTPETIKAAKRHENAQLRMKRDIYRDNGFI